MHKNRIFPIVIMLALTLSACNFPLLRGSVAEEAVVSEDALMSTAVAGTVAAMSVPAEPAAEFTLEPNQGAVEPTIPVLQPTNTVGVLPTTAAENCNQALFITETIPDGTQYNMGESFTKTWTLRNTGTCTWNTNYKLVFVSGDSMDAPEYVYFPYSVAPDFDITISVDMEAPPTAGTYTGYWALEGDDGVQFFSGIYVQIEATSAAFQVSSVTTDLKDREVSCSYEYNFAVSITSTSAGKAKYYVVYKGDNKDVTSSTRSVTFDTAGTITDNISWGWKIANSGAYSLRVYIESPNNQWFGPFKFDITCK